jgi:hypothetical protein
MRSYASRVIRDHVGEGDVSSLRLVRIPFARFRGGESPDVQYVGDGERFEVGGKLVSGQ